MLSRDIIERRIQMNPELLGFPGDSPRHPRISLGFSSAAPSLSHSVAAASPLQGLACPSFPACAAFLWLFDATHTPIRHCLEEPCKAID